MTDRNDTLNIARSNPHLAKRASWLHAQQDAQPDVKQDEEEDSCPAFGFLRGIRERALAVDSASGMATASGFRTVYLARGVTTLRWGCY